MVAATAAAAPAEEADPESADTQQVLGCDLITQLPEVVKWLTDVLPNRTLVPCWVLVLGVGAVCWCCVLVLRVGAACWCCVTAWHDATTTAGDPAFGLFGWSGTCACIRCHGLRTSQQR